MQVYRAEREQFDENGWKARIAVSVQGEDIVDVEYEEVNAQGALKRNDEEYTRRMQEASGITPVEAVTRLSEQLEQVDDPEEVDAVSGATGTSETFLDLAREALSNR